MKTDVVIPALNEEQTIKQVVRAFKLLPWVGQVFVMLDAHSTDMTGFEALKANANVITPAIHGKGELVAYALQRFVTTERVVLSDGDYTMGEYHKLPLNWLHTIPQVSGPNVMRIVVPEPVGNWPAWADKAAYAPMSGLRSFPVRMIENVPLYGYLTETQLNQAAELNHIPVRFMETERITAPLRFTEQRMADLQRDLKRGRELGILNVSSGERRPEMPSPADDNNGENAS